MRPTTLLLPFVSALAVSSPRAVTAQRAIDAGPGARVRLRTDTSAVWRIGTLDAVRPETLLVRPCAGCAREAYARGRVTAFDVSVGRRSFAGTGAALGALGVAAAMAADVARCERQHHGEGPPCALGYTVMPIYVIGGAIGGGFVGHLVHAGPERWRPARPVGARPLASAQPERPSGWRAPPVPGARLGARVGAMVGSPFGLLYALRRADCHLTPREGDQTACEMRASALGIAGGAFAGSVLGAGAGAVGRAHCPAGASFGRSLGGAALWTAPAVAVYLGALQGRTPGQRIAISFAAGLALPFVQAEGAARAAGGTCAGGGR